MSMTVTVPEGRSGDVEIRRIVTGQPSLYDLTHQHLRPIIAEGVTLTALYRNGQLWMSDTPAERRDHMPVITRARSVHARRALVNGLGLGMIVIGLIDVPTIEHIDVVEIDPDVITLVGPHVSSLAEEIGKTVVVHHGDAFTIQWPADARWDVAWSDIWQDACVTNLSEMSKLTRRYSRRVGWHGHWLKETLLTQRRRSRRLDQQRASWVQTGRSLWN